MLTPERIRELWENYSPTKGIESFARSVETEVRKDDEALIRQLRDALDVGRKLVAMGGVFTVDELKVMRLGLEAANARLGEKEGT